MITQLKFGLFNFLGPRSRPGANVFFLGMLFAASAALGYPYDSSLTNLPTVATLTGTGARDSGTVVTYNIPISNWPDQIQLYQLIGGDGGRAKATATIGSDQSADGGGGALIQATFAIDPTVADALRPGGELRLIIGNKGADKSGGNDCGAGGGGGSGLLYRAPEEGASWELLALAGGGGGGSASTVVNDTHAKTGMNANTTTYGDDSGTDGGTDGDAGVSYTTQAGGGGGWLQNAYGDNGGKHGKYEGGAGGIHFDSAADGGFGCGGGGAGWGKYSFSGNIANDGGGGGGGYSGGGAGQDDDANSPAGGGGGSYLSSRASSGNISERDGTKSNGSASFQAIPQPGRVLDPPTVTVSGDSSVTIFDYEAASYTDAGATATDVYGNNAAVITIPPLMTGAGTYTYTYTAVDQFGNTSVAKRTVTVVEATKPTFSLTGDVTVDEDSGNYSQNGFAYDFNANDAGQSLDSYLVINDSNALFSSQPSIDTNGKLTFRPAANANGSATVIVYAIDNPDDSSNGTSDPVRFTITVSSVDDPPPDVLLSTNSINENQTVVGTVSATDPFGGTVGYSITGGKDGTLFSVDADSGELSFISAPDYENPKDIGNGNTYWVRVTATGSDGSFEKSFEVFVLDVAGPSGLSLDNQAIAENTTAVGTASVTNNPNGDALTYALAGGADEAFFQVDPASGELSFSNAPNYEAPLDADSNNTYVVEVQATGEEGVATHTFDIVVTNANDAPTTPEFDNPQPDEADVDENTTYAGTVSSMDEDGDTLEYLIVGGYDKDLFQIDSASGAISFITPPDYENPSDQNGDNKYKLQVRATDGTTGSVYAYLTIQVQDVNEAPAIDIATTNQTLAYAVADIAVNGTNNLYTVGNLVWSNALTGSSGTVAVSGTVFSVPSIPLDVGTNTISVTGTNSQSEAASDSITVVRASGDIDSDGDGVSDADEAFIGSDPNDPDSVFKVSVISDGSGDMELSWPVFNSGLRYDLYGCTNLVEDNWFYVDSSTSSNLLDSTTNDAMFYRVDVIDSSSMY